jgi:SAM-dependent methyltransferase
MTTDAEIAGEFYQTAMGEVAAQMLRERLSGLWPNLAGQTVLGLGFAAPYLTLWREQAGRCIGATPAAAGLPHWPASLACSIDEEHLPFADLSIDRILLVHGLENAENARRMLREVWRVLKDDGRLVVVAPNRIGIWAHLEHTPFGQGQPYSPGQINRLLAASLFRVERRDTALYLPPTGWRVVLRGARLIERIGRGVAPRLAGVTLTEAVKDVYAAMPLRDAVRRRVVALSDAA